MAAQPKAYTIAATDGALFTVLAAQTGKRLHVHGWVLTATAALTISAPWLAGGTTLNLAANGNNVLAPIEGQTYADLSEGTPLRFTPTGGNVGGFMLVSIQ